MDFPISLAYVSLFIPVDLVSSLRNFGQFNEGYIVFCSPDYPLKIFLNTFSFKASCIK